MSSPAVAAAALPCLRGSRTLRSLSPLTGSLPYLRKPTSSWWLTPLWVIVALAVMDLDCRALNAAYLLIQWQSLVECPQPMPCPQQSCFLATLARPLLGVAPARLAAPWVSTYVMRLASRNVRNAVRKPTSLSSRATLLTLRDVVHVEGRADGILDLGRPLVQKRLRAVVVRVVRAALVDVDEGEFAVECREDG